MSANPPETGSAAAQTAQLPQPTTPPSENQGIPYTLRRIQIMDGIILSGIIAVFAITYEVKDEVKEMRAQRNAEEKVEAENPPVRREQFGYTVQTVMDRIKAVSDRVTDLEDDDKRE
jgi:hypothetical protein